ncbi:MAG: hypothetical protein HYT08_01415 [Candidatus Levybacteria bacterium]|nr:hypothetical protein [Candidatus Levybacteria bacterium]
MKKQKNMVDFLMRKSFLLFALLILIVTLSLTIKTFVRHKTKVPIVLDQKKAVSSYPIKRVVLIVQENHSFDSYFGTYPGADGFDPNTLLPRLPGEKPSIGLRRTQNTKTPSLRERAYHKDFDTGREDANGMVVMQYFEEKEIPNYWAYAKNFVLLDRLFSAVRVRYSVPSHFYLIAATAEGWMTNRMEKPYLASKTMIDLFKEYSISWKLYSGETFNNLTNVPNGFNYILTFKQHKNDKKVISNIVHRDKIFKDIKNGTLPQFSWIFPEAEESEHPPQNVRKGMNHVTEVINEIMKSKYWKDTAIIVIWDDFGGYFDHVKPEITDQFGPGPRVPGLVISAYSKKGYIDHTTYNTSSVLKFFQTLYNLPSLTERDGKSANMLNAFDFKSGPRDPLILPLIPVEK